MYTSDGSRWQHVSFFRRISPEVRPPPQQGRDPGAVRRVLLRARRRCAQAAAAPACAVVRAGVAVCPSQKTVPVRCFLACWRVRLRVASGSCEAGARMNTNQRRCYAVSSTLASILRRPTRECGDGWEVGGGAVSQEYDATRACPIWEAVGDSRSGAEVRWPDSDSPTHPRRTRQSAPTVITSTPSPARAISVLPRPLCTRTLRAAAAHTDGRPLRLLVEAALSLHPPSCCHGC